MLSDLFLGLLVATAASLAACRLSIAGGLYDSPHLARHEHRKPTPTSGGIGIATGYGLAVLALTMTAIWSGNLWLNADDAQRLAIATAFAGLFLGIGFIDDAWPLSARGKFAAFALVALVSAREVGVAHLFPITSHIYDVGFVIGLIGSALWVFTLMNAVNFLDGANGLAMGSVAVGLVGLAVVGWDLDVREAALMATCGAGALVGFLFWNFPNGKLFAGDSGALFAGALAALGGLMVIREGALSPFVPPMLFFPLLADALLTLAWRFARRRNLLDGHSEHIYQIALRAGWTHARAAMAYWLATAVCVAVAVLAERAGPPWPLTAFGALVIAALVINTVVRGYAVKRGIAEKA